jgi:hypothetical protein
MRRTMIVIFAAALAFVVGAWGTGLMRTDASTITTNRAALNPFHAMMDAKELPAEQYDPF